MAETFLSRLNGFLSSTTQLPTLPSVLWEIQAALQDKRKSASEIAFVIEEDPSLVTNILRLANSSFVAASSPFTSIKNAVAHLGVGEIEHLVSATIIIDTFSTSRGNLDYDNFWAHGLEVAEVAAYLCDLHPSTASLLSAEAYVAGLIHDVGKLILDQFFPRDFASACKYREEKSCSDADAELATLGVEHGEIAALLFQYSDVAPNLVEAVRWHHRVEQCQNEYRGGAEIIRRADALCHVCESQEIPEEMLSHSTLSLTVQQAKGLMGIFQSARQRTQLLLA